MVRYTDGGKSRNNGVTVAGNPAKARSRHLPSTELTELRVNSIATCLDCHGEINTECVAKIWVRPKLFHRAKFSAELSVLCADATSQSAEWLRCNRGWLAHVAISIVNNLTCRMPEPWLTVTTAALCRGIHTFCCFLHETKSLSCLLIK